MPVLSLGLDHSGKPIVELYVSMGTTTAGAYVEVGRPLPPIRLVHALVDTGASQSIVDLSVLISLDIDSVGETTLNTAWTGGSPIACELFAVNLAFAGDTPGPLIENLEVIGSDRLRGVGVQMLVGRDVLDRCLIVYNGPDRRISLAYDRPT